MIWFDLNTLRSYVDMPQVCRVAFLFTALNFKQRFSWSVKKDFLAFLEAWYLFSALMPPQERYLRRRGDWLVWPHGVARTRERSTAATGGGVTGCQRTA